MKTRVNLGAAAAAFVVSFNFGVATNAGAEEESAAPVPETNDTTVIQDYCLNIADKAADARAAWQSENLKHLEAEVNSKIEALEKLRTEVQGWVEKQDEMLKAANKGLVDIYTKMDPEAAAVQLEKIGLRTAVSIMRQLNPRFASAILNVMEPDTAAALVKAIASATQDKKAGQKS